MNVIEASGLGKRYGGKRALRECSLAIPAGHVAALVGPNGAGQTTLLNLAAGPDVVNGDGDRTGFSVVETGTDEVRADADHGGSALAGYVSPP